MADKRRHWRPHRTSSTLTVKNRFTEAGSDDECGDSHTSSLLPTTTTVVVDPYGFEIPDDLLPAWKKFNANSNGPSDVREWEALTLTPTPMCRKSVSLRARSGIPSSQRPRIWWYLSGAEALKANALVSYETLKLKSENAVVNKFYFMSIIDKDLSRTFPSNKTCSTPAFLATLRRVLTCYALYNPTVGYCQGLNYIVATLLLFVSEERAFWMLASLVEQTLSNYYLSLIGVRIDIHIIYDLFKMKLPDLHLHFQNLNFEVMLLYPVLTNWLMKLFINTFAFFEITLRIWDLLFSHGQKCMLRIVLAIFYIYQPVILKCETAEDIMVLLKSLKPSSLYMNIDHLIATAFTDVGALPKSILNLLRCYYRQMFLSDDDAEGVFITRMNSVAVNSPFVVGNVKTSTNGLLLATVANGRQVWGVDPEGNITVWDAETGNVAFNMPKLVANYKATCVADTGREVWIGMARGTIVRVSRDSYQIIGDLQASAHNSNITCIYLGTYEIFCTSASGELFIFTLTATGPVREETVTCTLSSEGRRAISCMCKAAASSEYNVLWVGVDGGVACLSQQKSKNRDSVYSHTFLDISAGVNDIAEIEIVKKNSKARWSVLWCVCTDDAIRVVSSDGLKHLSLVDTLHCGQFGTPLKINQVGPDYVWTGHQSGAIVCWASISKRIIKIIAASSSPITAMIPVINLPLSVTMVWTADNRCNAKIWIGADLTLKDIEDHDADDRESGKRLLKIDQPSNPQFSEKKKGMLSTLFACFQVSNEEHSSATMRLQDS